MAVMEMEEGVMDGTVEGPREKLRQIIEKNGDAILQDPDRVEGLLRDHCGSYRKEISALVGALNERVPLELKGSWQSAMTPEAMRARHGAAAGGPPRTGSGGFGVGSGYVVVCAGDRAGTAVGPAGLGGDRRQQRSRAGLMAARTRVRAVLRRTS